MRKILLSVLVILGACAVLAGCRKIDGPRFWWDDRNQERLSDGYNLPADISAPADSGYERGSTASGEDLSDNDLRDYRTNLDHEEEKRKSDASLLDF